MKIVASVTTKPNVRDRRPSTRSPVARRNPELAGGSERILPPRKGGEKGRARQGDAVIERTKPGNGDGGQSKTDAPAFDDIDLPENELHRG